MKRVSFTFYFPLYLFSCLVFAPTTLASNVNHSSTSLDSAQVTQVNAVQQANGAWCFYSTVKHNDQGWDHFANEWQVVDLNGNILGVRSLAHPHDDEQPFTRSKCSIQIPKHINKVVVRAKCNLHGYSGQTVTVDLNKPHGKGFSVKR